MGLTTHHGSALTLSRTPAAHPGRTPLLVYGHVCDKMQPPMPCLNRQVARGGRQWRPGDMVALVSWRYRGELVPITVQIVQLMG
jgi:hypothetical protein